MSSDTASHSPPSPTEQYAVHERISIGTAGIVYRATERGTGREVLFKLLVPEASHPLDTRHVLALAPVLKKLNHPRIAELLDAYIDPEGCVLVYPAVQGYAGNEFAVRQILRAREAEQVAKDILAALLQGEQMGLSHGDLKPSNLVISRMGKSGLFIQVQDWGLSVCRVEQPVETLQFMAPERLQGGRPTPQSDLFTLGLTLSYLLTGGVFVKGATREALLEAWSQFTPDTLWQSRPDLSEPFCDWLVSLLQLEPGSRPSTINDAALSLERALRKASGEAIDERPVLPAKLPSALAHDQTSSTTAPTTQLHHGPVKRAPRHQASRGSRLMTAIFCLCLLAAAGMVFVVWAKNRWGPDWKTKVAGLWPGRSDHERMARDVADTPSEKAAPLGVREAVINPAWLASESFTYPSSFNLDGNDGGTGWTEPWEAHDVIVSEMPDASGTGASFIPGKTGAMTRKLRATPHATSEGVAVVFAIWHPGPGGPVIEIDLLPAEPGRQPSPIIVRPGGKGVHISVKGGGEVLECAAAQNIQLAIKWAFGREEEPGMEIQVMLSPESQQDIKHVFRKGGQVPSPLVFQVRATSPGREAFYITDLRMAKTVGKALR